MTKEQAREILKDFIYKKINANLAFSSIGSFTPTYILPVNDEIITEYDDKNKKHEFSFRGLLKIAYDLEDKKI